MTACHEGTKTHEGHEELLIKKKRNVMADLDATNRAEWAARILNPHLKAEPERRASFTTISGLPLERLYTPEDTSANGAGPAANLGYPGAYPFTRGVTPTMYQIGRAHV